MQFMVELTHSPETCIASPGSSDREHHAELLGEIQQTAYEHGIELTNGWAFPIGHKLWYVVSASDAQDVTDTFFAAGVHRWNTVQIHPVLDHKTFKTKVLDGISGRVEISA
ncbi:MAG: hypothetical protein HOF01_00945 [Chloroflexi bacterium]|jgi:hypothetical protein|nr:hypothetical protein [Chloroflexota bacterium]